MPWRPFVPPSWISCYSEILTGVQTDGLNLAVFLAVGFLQVVSVQMFFLQDKLTSTEKHKPLAVNNRRAFSCFSYFFFFYNVVLGLTTCVRRLLWSLGIGTVLLARIDRTIMPKGYETRDLVFTWWVGMILADHYHANPTLVCFCDLLMSRAPEPQTANRLFHNTPHGYIGAFIQPYPSCPTFPLPKPSPESDVNCRARKRWALAYTLLRNPHLIPMRKHLLVPPPAPSASQPSDHDATIPTVVMAAIARI
ncbi:Stimulated by retinoic acid gene 6 protein-like [Merluccius polli]|uniref:Stimulated by retinoic acid gene 6 protein-like n=1 Tax=Merluccius polli TaxID=89951 RepID=A0AA47MGB6_MERPO|nr:Stimulated by retinoic acid gene 6 protein-like [Merluccius polli]